MDSTIIAAIIGAVATIVAVIIAWFLQRDKNSNESKQDQKIAGYIEQPSASSFSQRYLEYPSHYRFIKSLPKMKSIVLENAQEGWDTGITSDMREASYDVIAFLEYVWLRLAKFYPETHWKDQDAESYIQEYIQDRFSFHCSKHEPEGSGTGGTIVGVLTSCDVISDLEKLIADTVSALFMYQNDFDYIAWEKEWSE